MFFFKFNVQNVTYIIILGGLGGGFGHPETRRWRFLSCYKVIHKPRHRSTCNKPFFNSL